MEETLLKSSKSNGHELVRDRGSEWKRDHKTKKDGRR